jgi:exopolysaccharide biosynthesis polyprenyl glycosylphosphotransferase
MLLDGLMVSSSLWLAAAIRPVLSRFSFIETIKPPVAVPLTLYIIFPIIWILIYSLLSIYDGRRYLRAVDEFSALSMAMAVASISAAGILYFSYRQVSRVLFLVFALLVYLLCIEWRVLARLYFKLQKTSPDRLRRVLVVGIGPLGQNVCARITGAAVENLSMVGFVDDGFEGQESNPLLLGGREAIRHVISDRHVTDVVVALPHSAYDQMSDIVQRLEDLPVQVWVALGFFDLALYKTAIEDFAGIPMLDLRASAIDDYQRLVKRAFDITLGLIAVTLTLPLMILSILMILLDDGRPILFRQKRAGENCRVFDMLKFRTMYRNAEQLRSLVERTDGEGNLIHKTRDDPRVTRIGRYLRRFSLDELPQFFNVVRGEMSLVGPRPELTYLVEKYQPWQRKRFAVPPGMTGWWQVSGRSDKPMHLHTEEDLYYIQNYSIWLDVQIIVRTLWIVLIGKGSY